MNTNIVEINYPITFRKVDAEQLGKHLKNRDSVILIGMKRVGISNFLRFFLYHHEITATYIGDSKKHLFIPVDLNDLVEREIYPFWRLTFKRLVDAVGETSVASEVKQHLESLFLNSIQSQDLFLTIDGVRAALVTLVDNDIVPTIFFLRFDRMQEAITQEFFNNLQGVRDATHQQVAYVFTSSRGLETLSPKVFTKPSLALFSQDLYIKPAEKEDARTIFESYHANYRLSLDPTLEETFFDVVDGYVQYLHLGLIFLHEEKLPIKTKVNLFDGMVKDERIMLQSEELWESLTQAEKAVLLKVSKGSNISKEDKVVARYLWDTGFVAEKNDKRALFSPLFGHYLKTQEAMAEEDGVEFTKKEHLLFTFLKENSSRICEREEIVEAVWPEMETMGVSDWAIDRLVARVRSKLKHQKGKQSIQTIRTRGYRLIEA